MVYCKKLILGTLFLGSCLAVSIFPARAGQEVAGETMVCQKAIDQAERAFGIPHRLLDAVSRIESGRWSAERGENIAWPWTVMAEGQGRYLPSKEAAIAEVRGLLAKGLRNIDVGCLQVNLGYHPDAFASLQEAFDPQTNALYAASFLKDLRLEARSWTAAVGHYHNRRAVAGNNYRRKVHRQWQELTRPDKRRKQKIIKAKAQAAPKSKPALSEPIIVQSDHGREANEAEANPGALLTPPSFFLSLSQSQS